MFITQSRPWLPGPSPCFHMGQARKTAAPDRQGERRNNLHKGQLHAAPDLLTRHNFNCGHRWLSGKEPACQCRRRRFDPWVRKIPWRRRWQSTPVFLPGKSHGQRSLVGYGPQGHKELDKIKQLNSNYNKTSHLMGREARTIPKLGTE